MSRPVRNRFCSLILATALWNLSILFMFFSRASWIIFFHLIFWSLPFNHNIKTHKRGDFPLIKSYRPNSVSHKSNGMPVWPQMVVTLAIANYFSTFAGTFLGGVCLCLIWPCQKAHILERYKMQLTLAWCWSRCGCPPRWRLPPPSSRCSSSNPSLTSRSSPSSASYSHLIGPRPSSSSFIGTYYTHGHKCTT